MKPVVVFLFFLFYHASAAQMPDSIKAHIDTAIGILQKHSWYANSANWEEIRAGAYARASTARNKQETFEAIKYAWLATGDNHGMVAQYDDVFRYADSATIGRYSPNLYAEWAKGFKIKCEMIRNTAYLRFPAMNIFSQKDILYYATMLYDSVAKLAARKPKNWIIDLRMNGGGNLRPMLTALSLFFADGDLMYWQDKQFKIVDTLRFSEGLFYTEGSSTGIGRPRIHGFQKVKLAVIVGPGTGSSGEITAAALHQRKQTKMFGNSTAGVTNSTNGFVFNNDLSYLLFTTSQLVRKNGKPIPFQLKPDVMLELNDEFVLLERDNAVVAALKWLND